MSYFSERNPTRRCRWRAWVGSVVGPPRWPLVLAWLSVLAAGASPHHARAQAVRGVVIDDTNQQPVVSAMVRLVVGDELRDGRETDGAGRFLLPVPGEGEYRLEVARLGYETARSQPFHVSLSDTVAVEFRIAPDAVLLAPITVTARSRLGRHLFERRRSEWGRGVFLDRRAIDSLAPTRSADVLAGVEDVVVRWDIGTTSSGFRDLIPNVWSVRGRGCVLYMVDFVPVRSLTEDGTSDWSGYQLGMLDPDDIEAVEVYRSVLEVPPELRRYTYVPSRKGGMGLANCGLVVFWTRQGW